MSLLDAGLGHSNSLVDWAGEHGLAATLLACTGFWTVVAVGLYFVI